MALRILVTHWPIPTTSCPHNPRRRAGIVERPLPRHSHSHSQSQQPHKLRPFQHHRQLAASSHSQRVAPVLLKAEGVCIAAAACLQLASLYVLQTQVLTNYPAGQPTETAAPPTDLTEAAEQLGATTASETGLHAGSALEPATTTTEAVLQAGSAACSMTTQPEDRVAVNCQSVGAAGGLPPGPARFGDTLVCSSWLGALQGLLLCTALFCNALLRGRPPPASIYSGQAGSSDSSIPSTSAAAAAHVLRLEATVNAQATQLTQLSQQVEKLQLRTRLISPELKRPLQALQQQVAQQAGVMGELADAQAKLQKEAQDAQLLIAALQSVSAKQFKVLADALQRVSRTVSAQPPVRPTARKA